jgi:hypothetical protein
MPFASAKQQRWAHTAAGTKALGGASKVSEWDQATKRQGFRGPVNHRGSLRNAVRTTFPKRMKSYATYT